MLGEHSPLSKLQTPNQRSLILLCEDYFPLAVVAAQRLESRHTNLVSVGSNTARCWAFFPSSS